MSAFALTGHARRIGPVRALTTFDDGSGDALYVGGGFVTVGTVTTNGIAKWNGTTWAPLGIGTNGSVYALAAFDDGGGASLYAGGTFTTAGGVPANHIAEWNGSTWTALQRNDLSFHGGKLCVKAPFTRAPAAVKAVDGIGCTTCPGNCRVFQRDFNQLVQNGTNPLLTAGQTVHTQMRQRDPTEPLGFGDNLSNGLSFVIQP